MVRPEDHRRLRGNGGPEHYGHGGCGGGLRALLVHVDEGLVDHGRDVEVLLAVHPGEVGRRERERVRHAHLPESIAQAELAGELEPGQAELHLPPSKARQPLADVLGLHPVRQPRQAVPFPRQEHEHGQTPLGVGQKRRLAVVRLPVLEVLGLVHHRRVCAVLRRGPERLVARPLFLERLGPVALEVDGVGEHEAGQGAQDPGRDDVLDLAVRLLVHPVVDGPARGFGVAHEVQLRQACAVVVLQEVQEAGQEIEALLPPQGVGDAELASLGGAGPLDLVLQRGDGAVQLRLFRRQVKHARHLRGGIPARSRIRHRQCGGDAVGGEEDVPLPSFQPAVQLQGESIAGLHDGVLLLHGHPRGEFLDGACRAARQHDCRDSRRNSGLHSHSPFSLPGARGNGPGFNLWPAAPAVNPPDARRQLAHPSRTRRGSPTLAAGRLPT